MNGKITNKQSQTPSPQEYKLLTAKSQTKNPTPGPQEYKLQMAKSQTKSPTPSP